VRVLTDGPRISVARVVRTQGNRGEVAADLDGYPERFLISVRLCKRAVMKVVLDSFGSTRIESFEVSRNRFD
jgi:hypothetical protein